MTTGRMEDGCYLYKFATNEDPVRQSKSVEYVGDSARVRVVSDHVMIDGVAVKVDALPGRFIERVNDSQCID